MIVHEDFRLTENLFMIKYHRAPVVFYYDRHDVQVNNEVRILSHV